MRRLRLVATVAIALLACLAVLGAFAVAEQGVGHGRYCGPLSGEGAVTATSSPGMAFCIFAPSSGGNIPIAGGVIPATGSRSVGVSSPLPPGQLTYYILEFYPQGAPATAVSVPTDGGFDGFLW